MYLKKNATFSFERACPAIVECLRWMQIMAIWLKWILLTQESQIPGPTLERKWVRIRMHGEKIFFFKKLKKLSKTSLLGGGSHLRNGLPSTSSALLVSMSALQKSNIYVANKNDMLIKQKSTSLYHKFFEHILKCKHVLQVKKIKVYEIVLYRTFIEKIWFMYKKGRKKLWIEKYFYFALSNICMFLKMNVF